MNARYLSRLEQPADGSAAPESRSCTTIANSLAPVAEMLNVPAVEVTAVVTDDYRGEVERTSNASEAINESGTGTYTLDRVGGTAVAKAIPITHDRSQFRVVLDGTQQGPASDPRAQTLSTLFIGHELTHHLLDRLRWAGGAMDAVPPPSHTPFEVARSIVRVAIDEMRADIATSSRVCPGRPTPSGYRIRWTRRDHQPSCRPQPDATVVGLWSKFFVGPLSMPGGLTS